MSLETSDAVHRQRTKYPNSSIFICHNDRIKTIPIEDIGRYEEIPGPWDLIPKVRENKEICRFCNRTSHTELCPDCDNQD